MTLTLEDFAFVPEPAQQAPSDTVSRTQMEAEKSTSYENGYQAGFDDAAQAERGTDRHAGLRHRAGQR